MKKPPPKQTHTLVTALMTAAQPMLDAAVKRAVAVDVARMKATKAMPGKAK